MATVRQPIATEPTTATPHSPGELKLSSSPSDPTAIDERFEALLRQVQANRPSEDVSLIRKAWDFCVQHHQGQMRASGEPYVIHPLEVAEVLAEMKLDSTAIAAGLLHDAVEDTPATGEEIESGFGDQVAHIVEGVTSNTSFCIFNSFIRVPRHTWQFHELSSPKPLRSPRLSQCLGQGDQPATIAGLESSFIFPHTQTTLKSIIA